jgi:2-polyprenyl-3-methyl-5-hydroxy-6-metoxy-1,4-benzoquinol methylase
MMKWYKKTDLNINRERNREIWIREENNHTEDFEVELYLGKKTNLVGLKKNIIDSIKEQLKYYRSSRAKLYEKDNLEYVPECPVTGIDTASTKPVVNIYGAEYVQTPDTGHVYVKYRPKSAAIENFYLNDVTYAATYTNRDKANVRLKAIAEPWCQWMMDVFYNQYGRKPKSVLDVGSGAGHFVRACLDNGLKAKGIELNESSRDFAKKIWGIELDGRDFLKVFEEYKGCEIVTFWGLLEHTPFPSKILKGAHAVISEANAGMVISKVPRWDALGTAAQMLNSTTIIRHLDPMGHIMIFSDASAAEIYYRNQLKPISAWYYGMDVYETLMQIGNQLNTYDPLIKLNDFQINLQQFVDDARMSDGLTLVGIPK